MGSEADWAKLAKLVDSFYNRPDAGKSNASNIITKTDSGRICTEVVFLQFYFWLFLFLYSVPALRTFSGTRRLESTRYAQMIPRQMH